MPIQNYDYVFVPNVGIDVLTIVGVTIIEEALSPPPRLVLIQLPQEDQLP